MIVMKFGGSSVANAERIRHVASIIGAYQDKRPVVVLSAMGDTTDHLLEAADEAVAGNADISRIEKLHRDTADSLGLSGTDLQAVDALLSELYALLTGISMIRELTKRTRDYLVSFGERLSVRIVAAFLQSQGIPARFYDAWDAGLISDSVFMNAELSDDVWETIPEALGSYRDGIQKEIPVVTGFIAKDMNGNITTLGRGGSDLTATMIGAALQAEEIQTWKDVDGILSADPRIVARAKTVPLVTYEEAAELAYFGAQILHPRSMVPCRKAGIPVRVKNSYNPAFEGSLIIEKHTAEPSPVRAITAVKNSTLIDIVSTRMLGASGFLARIFDLFLKHDISIDVIATSEVSVSLTVHTNADLSGLVEDLKDIADIRVKTGRSIITLICDAAHSSSILASAFSALAENGINPEMISQGASKVNVGLVCENTLADKTVRTLHAAFFE
ncbi:aspartate kinase [Treponema sp. HNW]|uniref:aspartate kinase n=1 Tax=Treponema sp. HNW TaxID=3116654 RepID=UPI003D146CE7